MKRAQPENYSMKPNLARLLRNLSFGSAVLAVGGCSLLPVAKPDPTRYYVLTSRAMAVPAPTGAPAVQLRPIDLAAYLRNRPMIVRRGDNEIDPRDFALWGEPLEQGIARVLGEELRARGLVVAGEAGRGAVPGAGLQLAVRVRACEGTAGGLVDFRAAWELTRAGADGGRVAGGEFRAGGLQWDGKAEATLAARLSEAVAGLAAEIAGAVAEQAGGAKP